MDSLTDITLNGETYRLAPGGYQRAPVTVPGAAPERQSLASFGLGLGFSQDDELTGEQGGGWSGLAVRSVGDGAGVEPFPATTTFNDAIASVPATGVRAHSVITDNRVFVGIGQRVYRSVALDNGTWSALAEWADLGGGFTILDMAYYGEGGSVLLMCAGADIRQMNIGTGALTIWRAGEQGAVGIGYANQLLYANSTILFLSGTKWNGNAVTHRRFVDGPIANMALFDSEVVIATRTSLYRMGGQPYPGEADDAAVTGDTSKAPAWIGDPEPLLSHGVYASAFDDFTFLCAFQGKLYTWLGGRTVEYDGGQSWRPMGPRGVVCYGGCVAGDWLVIALTAANGDHELWGFDGVGWWRLIATSTGPILWPTPLGGAGNRDVAVFINSSDNYHLVRLRWRATSIHTYATTAEWISPLLTGRDAGMDKAWLQIDAWFAWPETPGNPASGDLVTIALDYSIDAGATWTEIDTASVTVSREQHLSHRFTAPPVSRLLQLRVRWSSVSDWAPILSHLDVDFAVRDTRQRWTLDVAVRDQLDGSGRAEIDALWDAWREAAVQYRDIDYDTNPQERTVRVLEVAEKAPGTAGSGQEWTGSIVSVQVSEV